MQLCHAYHIVMAEWPGEAAPGRERHPDGDESLAGQPSALRFTAIRSIFDAGIPWAVGDLGMTSVIIDRARTRIKRSDLVADLESLFTFAVPAHFLKWKGPSSVLRMVAVACALYGAGETWLGFFSGKPFRLFDFAPLFLMSSVPLCLLASILEDCASRFAKILDDRSTPVDDN